MTFTYDPELATSKDRVRFRIGDTDTSVVAQQRLEDEEIEATVADASFPEAMARCAEALAAKFMRSATSKQAASLKVDYSKRVDHLLDLAKRIRSGAESIGLAEIVLTGTTKTEIETSAADTDLIQPAFTRGHFDNPDSVSLDEVTA